MLIIITKDPKIVRFYTSARSGSGAWGQIVVLDPGYDQTQATRQLSDTLAKLPAGESLCLVGHGNDTEIGGSGKRNDPWGWHADELAGMLSLLRQKPDGVLFEACALDEDDPHKVDPVFGFAQAVWSRLNGSGQAGKMKGVTIFGYQNGVPVEHTLPRPGTAALDKNVELTGLYVS
ncbi:hypothetical protein [Hamadaea tsunoensis]|uniref:hypothetical protein n=1 Tax=Hamadaea tsunoensis TaxID=53368 RepID=UPI0003F72B9B|nr:hypothetical protein [Hamadaea tsunoensis]